MKKLMYLLVVGTIFVFASCNCGSNDSTQTSGAVEEAAPCADDCQKACCLGCHATEGEAVCLPDHSCCANHEGDATEGHDHSSHEGHDHGSHEGHHE